MMDDDIGELVLTVIHLQAPLDSDNFHAPVLLSTCARIHSTIIYSTNHVYLHRFSRLRFCVLRLKRKTHPAFRVLNVFYFQTDFNLRFKRKRDVRLTCHRV